MLLLELPQPRVDIERAAEVRLPLLVAVLGEVAEAVEQLLRFLQQVAELIHDPSLVLRHGATDVTGPGPEPDEPSVAAVTPSIPANRIASPIDAPNGGVDPG